MSLASANEGGTKSKWALLYLLRQTLLA